MSHSTSATEEEQRAMLQAAALAGAVVRPWPNPPVGAVILDPAGREIGRGWHERAGGPHAEVAALAAAGNRARGATMVVTLEPCRHRGRTGPCTERILASGISRVVYAVADPTAAGGGAADLQRAGISVVRDDPHQAAAVLLEPWLFHLRTKRPWVTWKVAASLDGSIVRNGADTRDPQQRWITSPESRQEVHRLRAQVGAIVTSTATVLDDDPLLTARPQPPLPGRAPDPLRVVVGERSLAGTRLGAAIATGEALGLPRCPPAEVLAVLHERGVHHALLECGSRLAGAFAAAGLIDELIWFIAPVILAGPIPALSWPNGEGDLSLAHWRVTPIGVDLCVRARVQR
ncbi:MAG: bifunctional diaminohydroxyphosphoribosylaminopyrimidine deaminase/5-amino-6-(5-phosphoribosylamino)uracil reductase RibD [Actinomycetales bacterium]|nr:bifunctional diaminohydroxyphosphoribosylaminopyrimidine deaminase/5-amino-6-(5-phosphoribosylamino)uracil reductase RibD [Actinomycetales bacterium]